MTVNIQKLNVKVPTDGQVVVPAEVLEALGAQAGEDLEFSIYADGVMLRMSNFRPVKVAALEEAREKAVPFDENGFMERYTYYWSLRD
ncbi:MAG: AbrB/MazE/SpoVT family DNA-binding domain-containing protein [Chloroflexi bacterium]|nr:AbrB/MazE/SpoVT family DNA-binding domain-containing protein [Chloroflexota bacterium]